jgi:hypothetical protein
VKSEGDFQDILAQETPDVWTSNRPPKAANPAPCSRRSSSARQRRPGVARNDVRAEITQSSQKK